MAGRGEYYKQLYGGRGRGRGRGRGGRPYAEPPGQSASTPDAPAAKRPRPASHRSSDELLSIIRTLNGKSYPAYRDIQGSWVYQAGFTLHVDYIQGDPYAPPSKFRLFIPQSVSLFPHTLMSTPVRRIALCDYLTRQVCRAVDSRYSRRENHTGGWASEKGGQVSLDRPGQQVLERSSVVVVDAHRGDHPEGIELRFCVSLPAQGRSILGPQALEIFSSTVTGLYESLLYTSQDPERLADFVDSIEDQEELRRQVIDAGAIAFVPNGAILPRSSGASDAPMTSPGVVPFQSPPNLERTFTLPHRGAIVGMVIPRGIIMVAGGGFHGKSTLLSALAYGCYNHVPGDGREFLVASPYALSIQGEDGRAITNVDISPFIANLPGGISTASFSTRDASGSTSMAAGVVEALELGADTLLFDEDTCATNFLIRDRRMQRLISADPITPLVYKVRSMFTDHGCSSILVIGGCGDYCDVADLVLEMRAYRCYDITPHAKRIAHEIPSAVPENEAVHFGALRPRKLDLTSLPSPDTKMTVRTRSRVDMSLGGEHETLELSALVQLAHESQTRAIVAAIRHLHSFRKQSSKGDSERDLSECMKALEEELDMHGMDALCTRDRIDGFLARPRSIEVAMALNRMRTIRLC